jgi:hypothetical protein
VHANVEACTRSWGNSVNYIIEWHLDDQASCAVGSLLNCLDGPSRGNMIQAFLNMNCSEEAWNDFSISLDLAAAQYEACTQSSLES